MARWSVSIIAALVCAAIAGGCSSNDSGSGTGGTGAGGTSGSSCEKLCTRAGQINCATTDCVQQCETQLPKCDTEYRALVDCLANAQMLGCDASGKPAAPGECDSQNQAVGSCLLGGTGGTGGTGGSAGSAGAAGSAGSAGSGPCDPLSASCVGCGSSSEPCGASQACCWSDPTPTCKAAGSCTSLEATCDGSEDCSGGQCCVSFLATQDGSASSGKAMCSPGGGSVCCTPTPGTKGCAGDTTVEQCVCAKDDWCCTMEWDAQCAAQVQSFGCGTCGAGCELGASSTGSGSSIKSVSCRTKTDCVGVKGQFNVPYSECCKATNFGVGACVSETYASAITTSGGSCN